MGYQDNLICPKCRAEVKQVYSDAYYCRRCDTYSTFEEVEKEKKIAEEEELKTINRGFQICVFGKKSFIPSQTA
ncbi:hypothetical protein AKJ49_00850 [candidate division MSBL1 archaeon SCGC-AAA382A03]|uniref:Uncharacterized protein n=1 Tax=candidate division MSBL1 archaeon SCGC-AAA382A03 TaxID=1698278 RepID=A0A133VG46_9EURY|nr:hypothetical protein AKJ49_00850 [candidate division MSBL1 archaeon SCGC-AAA382A03]